jgi:predicted Zn-dependent peptidase
VLSISGDIDPDQTMSLVKKYFGDIKPQPNVPKYDPPKMPDQTSPRNAVMEDAHAKLAAVIDAWPIPAAREKDHYALELASMVLTDGESSRLYKYLVRDRAIAADVSSGTDDHRGPDQFSLTAKVAGKAKPEEVAKLLRDEVDKLGKQGPTEAEMTKVKNRIKTQFLMGLQSNIARAQRLAEFELYWGDANLLNSELDKYLAVTAADVKKAVATYLVPQKATHIDVLPAPEKK